MEVSEVKENTQAIKAGHIESPPDPLSRPCHVPLSRENFKLNLRPESIPTPQMLSLRIIMDNVVLIRRVEILADVQKACHLRIHQYQGYKQPAKHEPAQVEEF